LWGKVTVIPTFLLYIKILPCLHPGGKALDKLEKDAKVGLSLLFLAGCIAGA